MILDVNTSPDYINGNVWIIIIKDAKLTVNTQHAKNIHKNYPIFLDRAVLNIASQLNYINISVNKSINFLGIID